MRNYLDKIDFMISEKKSVGYNGPYRMDIVSEKNGWKNGEIASVIQPYLNLSESYIKFIQQYDSIGIAWVVFYGSVQTDIIPLKTELPYWREEGLPEDYFPFGKYVDGSIFCFDSKQNVIFFDKYDYNFEEPQIIAKSFDDFMNNCLFKDQFGNKKPTEGTAFNKLLKDQGWLDSA